MVTRQCLLSSQPLFCIQKVLQSAIMSKEIPLLLPTETVQAGRFNKTRTAKSTALREDYVELIADLVSNAGEARATDIARRLGVSHASAIKAVSRLKREGLATSKPYRGIFLTPEGQILAQRVKTRHRLVVDVLVKLGVTPETAEADAEGIEHYVSDETLAVFSQFLDRPNS